jgi:hypothetical protein
MTVSSRAKQGIVNAASNVYAQAVVTAAGTSYAELIASTSVPILVTHVFRYSPGSVTIGVTDVILGTGASSSEVVCFTGRAAGASSSSVVPAEVVFALPYPIRIAAGVRVAIKLGASDSNSTLGIIYVKESDVR